MAVRAYLLRDVYAGWNDVMSGISAGGGGLQKVFSPSFFFPIGFTGTHEFSFPSFQKGCRVAISLEDPEKPATTFVEENTEIQG